MGKMKALDIDLKQLEVQIEAMLDALRAEWNIQIQRIELDEGVNIITDVHEAD